MVGCLFLHASQAQTNANEVVTYEAFGAKGDGVTDDFEAVVAAHAYANEHRRPVRAADGATYYISGKALTATIQTDTDFGSAKFIIDDTQLEDVRRHVFRVQSALEPIPLEGVSSLRQGQERLDVKLPQPALLIAVNAEKRQYIRRGANVNTGTPQRDVFVVNEEGRVDPETPILWDFASITSLTAYPIDTTPLKITGGHFTTIANQHESVYNYHRRGISINRSNVTVEDLTHTVTGEGDHGAPYSGFLAIARSVDVTVRDSQFTARKTYQTIGRAGTRVSMGSYGLSVHSSHNVIFENCVQLNDIHDRTYWGIMASNFSKNLKYVNCRLSRFDAHQGVYNATILDSEIGHAGINLIGRGTFLLENSTVTSGRLIAFRSDYGSTWEGEIVIRNTTYVPTGRGPVQLFIGNNDGTHDFGYRCYMPERFLLENLHIEDGDRAADVNGPFVFGNFNPRFADPEAERPFPLEITREVLLKGVTSASGKPLVISPNEALFANTQLIQADTED